MILEETRLSIGNPPRKGSIRCLLAPRSRAARFGHFVVRWDSASGQGLRVVYATDTGTIGDQVTIPAATVVAHQVVTTSTSGAPLTVTAPPTVKPSPASGTRGSLVTVTGAG